MALNTPVLLLAWRRPDTLSKVISAIRKVAPNKIYVACDGPNPDRPGECEKVASTRSVIEDEIDWPCQIERFFSYENQGCRLGVSRAISWFFEQEDEGIILEDDCLPIESFFYFCDEMLARYRSDSRIWQISGTTFFQEAISATDGDYFFSRYGPIWGWATWKRAWSHYDSELSQWPAMSSTALMSNVYPNIYERKAKHALGSKLYNRQIDTWDYQWGMCKNFNNALTVVPNRNQIVNIGFSEDATHTLGIDASAPSQHLPLKFPLSHPQFIVEDIQYSSSFAKRAFKKTLLTKILKKILPIK